MELVRAAEIMATHPEHRRLPCPDAYELGGAFSSDRFRPLIEASVPLVDCGFMHADAVYDVVSVSRGMFFRLDQHQERFARSCEAILVRNPMDREREAEIMAPPPEHTVNSAVPWAAPPARVDRRRGRPAGTVWGRTGNPSRRASLPGP